MTCVILQPSYIPWRGYFDQIRRADTFVFLDDVQYDKQGWRNRNRIKTPNGSQWLTIPVLTKGSLAAGLPINEAKIDWRRNWIRKHVAAFRMNYARSPFFKKYMPVVEALYAGHPDLLADFTIDLSIALAGELGITETRFVRSSALSVTGEKTDRLVGILRAVGADHYVSGPSARAYLEEGKLSAHGISFEYMTYDYPEYEQLYAPFDPYVSVLDLLFMAGPDAGRYIWGEDPEL